MFLIQLLLPLHDNAGKPFPREFFEEVRRVLTERFGGVTAYQRSPAIGFWKDPGDDVSRDEVVMIEVMGDRLDKQWWTTYRGELETKFRQEELLVRAMEVHKL